jgi:hypothetical protein
MTRKLIRKVSKNQFAVFVDVVEPLPMAWAS